MKNILQSLKVTMKENLKLNCSKDRQIVLTYTVRDFIFYI